MKLIAILSVFLLMTSSLIANETLDNKILDFQKKRFSNNERVKITSLKINTKKAMPQKDWYGYIIDIDAKVGGKEINAKDIVFSNGQLVSSELFDLESGKSLKDLMTPKLTDEYYDEEKLIEGKHKAKNKIVVFSDPLCPFCMDFVPDVINYVKKHKNIALYYYHFPLLNIHPASAPLTALMVVAKKDKIKDIESKVYEANWEEYFQENEKDPNKIINAFNKEFKTAYTLDSIKKDYVEKELSFDINMGNKVMVQGTPTIFINGEIDKSKIKYETLGE